MLCCIPMNKHESFLMYSNVDVHSGVSVEIASYKLNTGLILVDMSIFPLPTPKELYQFKDLTPNISDLLTIN